MRWRIWSWRFSTSFSSLRKADVLPTFTHLVNIWGAQQCFAPDFAVTTKVVFCFSLEMRIPALCTHTHTHTHTHKHTQTHSITQMNRYAVSAHASNKFTKVFLKMIYHSNWSFFNTKSVLYLSFNALSPFCQQCLPKAMRQSLGQNKASEQSTTNTGRVYLQVIPYWLLHHLWKRSSSNPRHFLGIATSVTV